MRRLLLSLLGGVPLEDYEYECRMRDAERDFAHEDQLRACRYKSDLHADLARAEKERDAAHAEAGEWCTNYHDAEKRIADLEAKLADMRKRLEASNVAYNRTGALRWETKRRLDQAESNLEASRAKVCELEAKLAEKTECAEAWKRKSEGYQRRAAGLLELEQVQKATELACEVDNLTAKLAEVERRLAEATSPLALAERRYAQARLRYLHGRHLGASSEHWEPMLSAENALRRAAIDAAAAKGEGGEGER